MRNADFGMRNQKRREATGDRGKVKSYRATSPGSQVTDPESRTPSPKPPRLLPEKKLVLLCQDVII
jgi:hypothetical protein